MEFTKDKDGFIHLQMYLGGFLALPTFAQVLGGYGFHRGFKTHNISFTKLVTAVFFGLFMSIVLLFGMRGEDISDSNYKILSTVHPDILPVGAKPLKLMVVLGLTLFMNIALALYAWLAGQCGRATASVLANFTKRHTA